MRRLTYSSPYRPVRPARRLAVAVALALFGCGDDATTIDAGRLTDGGRLDAGSDDAGSSDDGGADDDAGEDDAGIFDAGSSDSGNGDAGSINACAAAEGICVTTIADCATGGGSRMATGDEGCRFDDGDGICCRPPPAEAAGDTCASHGGLCASVSGCNFVGGHFAPPSCETVPFVCCVVEAVCGVEDVVCCGDGVSYRPQCDRGTYRCDAFPGTTLEPVADCP